MVDMKPKINEIYKDDVEQLYVVREVFSQTCIVCPLVNTDFFGCEIMEFTSMEGEGWECIGKAK